MDPRNAGVCAFAARDVERGEVVEYEGELIDSEEETRRSSERVL